jgi:hypothetical protein
MEADMPTTRQRRPYLGTKPPPTDEQREAHAQRSRARAEKKKREVEAAREDRHRAHALSILQMAGRWEPFVAPSGKLFWRVPSEKVAEGKTDPDIYTVHVGSGLVPEVFCTCPSFAAQRPNPCKHARAVKSYQRLIRVYEDRHREIVNRG